MEQATAYISLFNVAWYYSRTRPIRHRLIHQLAYFVTSFNPLEVFCSANTTFAVSLSMSKQLVRVGIQKNLGSLSESCYSSQIVCQIYTRGAKRDPTTR